MAPSVAHRGGGGMSRGADRGRIRGLAARCAMATIVLSAVLVSCGDRQQAPTGATSAGMSSPSTAPATARIGRIRADLKNGWTFTIAADREVVSLRAPDGKLESMAWADVVRIIVVTTNEGPRLSDVFFFLESAAAALVIPQDAEGNEAFVHALLSVDGFNTGLFIDAMSSVDNAEFECWSGTRLQFDDGASEKAAGGL